MAFLLITESIENVIHSLEWDEKVLKRANNIHGGAVYLEKLLSVREKLEAAKKYQRIRERKTDYQKIAYLKELKPNKYINECVEICRKLKGVTFIKKSQLFRVTLYRNGKRKYIGQFDTPDDAMEILKLYM